MCGHKGDTRTAISEKKKLDNHVWMSSNRNYSKTTIINNQKLYINNKKKLTLRVGLLLSSYYSLAGT